MRTLGSSALTYVQSHPGVCAKYLIWITGKNRTTLVDETMGLWTGDDHETFSIGGSRLYYGAGTVVGIEPFTFRAGLEVRMQTVTLSILTPEVEQAIRGYEPRGASVEIHQVLFDTATNALIDTPLIVFDGYVEELRITTPELGGEASLEMTLASSSRVLTRTLPQAWSDASLKLRSGDRIARFADVSGSVDTAWGEYRVGQEAREAARQARRVAKLRDKYPESRSDR